MIPTLDTLQPVTTADGQHPTAPGHDPAPGAERPADGGFQAIYGELVLPDESAAAVPDAGPDPLLAGNNGQAGGNLLPPGTTAGSPGSRSLQPGDQLGAGDITLTELLPITGDSAGTTAAGFTAPGVAAPGVSTPGVATLSPVLAGTPAAGTPAAGAAATAGQQPGGPQTAAPGTAFNTGSQGSGQPPPWSQARTAGAAAAAAAPVKPGSGLTPDLATPGTRGTDTAEARRPGGPVLAGRANPAAGEALAPVAPDPSQARETAASTQQQLAPATLSTDLRPTPGSEPRQGTAAGGAPWTAPVVASAETAATPEPDVAVATDSLRPSLAGPAAGEGLTRAAAAGAPADAASAEALLQAGNTDAAPPRAAPPPTSAVASPGAGLQVELAAASGTRVEAGAGFSAPLGTSQWNDEFVGRVNLLLRNGLNEASLQLNPPELGRLDIRIATEGDRAVVLFTVQNGAAREAIDMAMPRLREMLEQSGLQLAHGEVADQSQSERGHSGSAREHFGHGTEEQMTGIDAEAADAASAGSGLTLSTSLVDYYI